MINFITRSNTLELLGSLDVCNMNLDIFVFLCLSQQQEELASHHGDLHLARQAWNCWRMVW